MPDPIIHHPREERQHAERTAAGALGFDLRMAARSLGRRPAFTATVAGTLALALGALAATLAVVDGVLLRPLPYPEADRLVAVCEVHPSVAHFCVASPPDVADWLGRGRGLEAAGIARDWPFAFTQAGSTTSVMGGLASAGLFDLFGMTPSLGRGFSEADLAGRARVVVLSDGFWRSALAGDSAVIGRGITLDDSTWTVIGVLRAGTGVATLDDVELWAPLPFPLDDPAQRGWRGFRAFARLAPGTSLAEGESDLRRVARELASEYPPTNAGWDVAVRTLRDDVTGPVRPLLLVFLTATALVLLVAAANIANLMLARASARSREMAIQAAVGGGRARMVRTLLFESLLIALLATALAIVVAYGAVRAFLRFVPADLPRLDMVRLSPQVLAVAALIGAVVAFLAGLAPMVRLARLDLSTALRSTGADAGRPSTTGRGALIVVQVAVAVTLLTGAALLARSFLNLARWRPGFDTDHLMVAWTSASPGRFRTGDQVAALQQLARQAAGAVPGVIAAGNVSNGPLFGGMEPGTFVSREEGPRTEVTARWYDATPGYFEALGAPLIRGRALTAADRPGAPRAAVVNETFARRMWPGLDPLGRRVALDDPDGPLLEVVGVVRDVPPFRAGDAPTPELWWSFDQMPRWGAYLVVRTEGPPARVAAQVRERVEAEAAGLRVGTFRTLPDLIHGRLVAPRFNLLLIGGFALLSVVMAMVGLYGLVSYLVTLRQRELAIRMALGASTADVRRSVLWRGFRLALAGLALGLLGAVAIGRLLGTLLAGVSPLDPVTFALVPLVVLACVLVATWRPSWRASRVQPMTLLRAD